MGCVSGAATGVTISEFLTTTPQNKRVLAEKAGTSTREVELLIHAARLEGVPILSNSDGYYLARNAAEIRACAARLRSRALTQLETAGALDKAAEGLARPLIFDWTAQ